MGRFLSNKSICIGFLILFLFPFGFLSIFISNASYSTSFPTVELLDSEPDVDLSDLPEIDYDKLEDAYYDSKIEMLIITPDDQDFVDVMTPLKEWKNQKGVKTIILSNYSQYSGDDGPEKVRNMIIAYHETENIKWVLLAGDAENNLVPIREVYNPDVYYWGDSETEPHGSEFYKPTDFYYADLTGTWDDDEDGKYGEAPEDNENGEDEIDWLPDVYVGRFPADTEEELERMVNRTLKYETNPKIGDWMNNMLLGAGVSSTVPDEDEAVIANYIINNYVSSEMNYTLLTRSGGDTLAPPAFENDFNDGNSVVFFAGHGSPQKYLRTKSLEAFSNTDASSSTNYNMPSLVYADACATQTYDATDDSVGESLILRSMNAGAIGVIGGLRLTWYMDNDDELEMLNRGNAKLFYKEFFRNEKFQPGKALYDSKVSYITSDYYTEGYGSLTYVNSEVDRDTPDFERKNVLTYNLLGDPEVDIYTKRVKDVANTLPSNIYEGQLVEMTVRDNASQPVPNARVHLETADGKYFTVYADDDGDAEFRLLPQANEFYNVTITGHNILPGFFNFTTLPDEVDPEIEEVDWTPKDPTVSENICFDAEADDTYSGIESVFVLLSDNDFEDYTYDRLSNETLDDENEFTCDINKLDPGEYEFLIVARDWADNTEIAYKSSYKVSIPTPITYYVLIIASVLLIGVTGCSAFIIFKGNKDYEDLLEREKTLETI